MTLWFTERVEARARLARALLARGEPYLREFYLRPEDVAVIATEGETAKQADREQQVQLAEAAQARVEGRDLAASVDKRDGVRSAVLPAVVADLLATNPSEAGVLAKLSFARYRVRVSEEPGEPATDAERELVRRVERGERSERRARAQGLAALCATLAERPVIMGALHARGMEPAFLESLRADAEAVALLGSNRSTAAEATARESAAVRAQSAKWSAVKHLVRRACAPDQELSRLLSAC